MLLEKVETIILAGALSKISSTPLRTWVSDGVYPSISAFVESANKRSTPSVPNLATLEISKVGPTGVKSILKSPVSTILPSFVSTQIPKESGIECVTRKKETTKSSAILRLYQNRIPRF